MSSLWFGTELGPGVRFFLGPAGGVEVYDGARDSGIYFGVFSLKFAGGSNRDRAGSLNCTLVR